MNLSAQADNILVKEHIQAVQHIVPNNNVKVIIPSSQIVGSETLIPEPSEITLSQLESWIYTGSQNDKWQAVSYLPDFGHESIPLLLNIIYSNNELSLKEQAIALLADVDPALLSSLKLNLIQDNNQLIPMISVLGGSEKQTAFSEFNNGFRVLENEQTRGLITELRIGSDEQRELAINRLLWTSDTEYYEVLDWVASKDSASSVRLAAIKVGLTFDGEHPNRWIKKALHDIEPEIQAFALQQIQTLGLNVEFFSHDLIGILYSNSNQEIFDKVMELLQFEPAYIGLDVLAQ
ncbi:hypothetical protein L0668_11030 [Paraglaciecola aquimarina]|uniref:HEAT repeat domain-containing protein n=1 Tax=Paraglaciecola algarum TaxID=3050085 RepID=A0ABS9DAH3_9ALTE|nr:hypothetical protein [Paraglaciecola sp. G1-23]MCF2948641.1 hypothetical protein [Paraglaciecola sp. G1-23]